MSHKRRLSHAPVACRYLNYRLPNGRVLLLPLIQVELTSETEIINTTALLDSGATLSFIQYEIAEILDVIPAEQRSIDVETAGGPSQFFPVRLRKLSVLVGGEILCDFVNAPVLVPIKRENDLPYAILGRDMFFKRFYVTFMEKKKRFILVHHKWAEQ